MKHYSSPRNCVRKIILAFVLPLAFVAALLAAIPANATTGLLDVVYSSGGNIWKQSSDGAKTQLTFSGTQDGLGLDVSPDGRQIAYGERLAGPITAIWIMGIDGSNPQQISSPNNYVGTLSYAHDLEPRWSPSGKTLSFEREVTNQNDAGVPLSTNRDIFTVDVATRTENSVTGTQHWAAGPAVWSPDGTRLVYWKIDSNGLSIIGADGSGEHPVALGTQHYYPSVPAWSSDGNTIYFDTTATWGIQYFTSSDKFTTVLGSSTAKNLTTSTDYSPRISPDGKSVWFLSPMPGGRTLNGISLVDGSSLTQPLTGLYDFSFIPAATIPITPAFKVTVDSTNVGALFDVQQGKRVLTSAVLPYPSQSCVGKWEVSTENNTDFALYITTNGNVSATRIDAVGKIIPDYLLPGGKVTYCVDFTRLNEIFNVRYDLNETYARTIDAELLLLNAVSLPTGLSVEEANFLITVGGIPEISQLGTCISKVNPACALTAIRKLEADQQSMNILSTALIKYAADTGFTGFDKFIDKSLGKAAGKKFANFLHEKLTSVVTSSLFVTKYVGQSFLSTAGYVSFETKLLK